MGKRKTNTHHTTTNATKSKKVSQKHKGKVQWKKNSNSSNNLPKPLKNTPKKLSGLSKMQEQMRKRLDGGKFRMLNEQLYTTTGKNAFETFQEDPELFDVVCIFFLVYEIDLSLIKFE
jgi:ribosomal RNA-processing protein 8